MRSLLWAVTAALALVAVGPTHSLADEASAKDKKSKADAAEVNEKDKQKDAKEKDKGAEGKIKEKDAAAKDKDTTEKAELEEQAQIKAKREARQARAKAAQSKDAGAEGKAKASKKVRLAHIKIEGALPESPGEMSLFGDSGADLRKMMSRLERAADDKSVAGVVLEIDSYMGRGKLNEVRSSIKRVQAAGKKVYAVMESAVGPQYQVAAACDEIVLPESGDLLLPGVRAEFSFYKDLLAKLGIEADMMHVGDYKGAAEPYTRDSLSEPVRKNMTALIDDMYDDMLTTIAADRDLKVEEVRKAVDRGLLSAEEAKEAGLIDRVAYPDEFRSRLEKEYKSDRLVYVLNYAKKSVDTDFSGPMGMMKMFQTMFGEQNKKEAKSGAKVAIVYAVGPIMSGESQSDPFAGSVMGSTTIVEALRKADKDDDVKAIVLRVDSPGGSALASDLIWRQTQTIDKPIVVSMGDVAASGGYYISMGADKIFAEPGTITGSIGVVGGKMAMKGFYNLIGMDTEVIARGDNSGIFSSTDKFSKNERDVIEKWMKDIYGQFTAKAAKGRGMKLEDLEKLAGGQIYSGRTAKRIGLIDEIGTLRDAVNSAKRLAGLDADEKVELKILPEPQNPFEALFGADMDAPKEDEARLMAGLLRLAPELRGPLRHAAQLRQVMREPVALMMPYWVEIK